MKDEELKHSFPAPDKQREKKFFEKRILKRIPVRKNEGVTVTLKTKSSSAPLNARLLDISSNGIGIETDDSGTYLLQKNNDVELEIEFQKNRYIIPYTVILVEKKPNGKIRTGLQRTDTALPIQSSKILFTAIVTHPFYYDELVLLNITDISTEKIVIECDDSEFIVFTNMHLSLLINESGDSKTNTVLCRVNRVHIQESGKIIFEALIVTMSSETKQMIANQLFWKYGWEPKKMRIKGFCSKEYRSIIRYRTVSSEKEYKEVLKLRKHSYFSVGKISENCTDKELASELDSKSRILTAYHNERLIGTVSITFPDSDSMVLDTEKTFENGYPKKIPQKNRMIEISRLCIHETYRSTDIMFGFFEHIYRILITSERDYIITSADEQMWPLYKKIGFSKTGMTYSHPLLNGLIHHVIIVHRNCPLQSKNVSIMLWGRLYKNMTEHLLLTDALSLNMYEKYRFIFNKAVYNIAKTFLTIPGKFFKSGRDK